MCRLEEAVAGLKCRSRCHRAAAGSGGRARRDELLQASALEAQEIGPRRGRRRRRRTRHWRKRRRRSDRRERGGRSRSRSRSRGGQGLSQGLRGLVARRRGRPHLRRGAVGAFVLLQARRQHVRGLEGHGQTSFVPPLVVANVAPHLGLEDPGVGEECRQVGVDIRVLHPGSAERQELPQELRRLLGQLRGLQQLPSMDGP